MKVKSESEVAQSCPSPSDPMDCSLPGSAVHGIFQARVLERGAVAISALITIRNAIIMKILKYSDNYQKVTQKHKVSKCWKNDTDSLAQHRVRIQNFNL